MKPKLRDTCISYLREVFSDPDGELWDERNCPYFFPLISRRYFVQTFSNVTLSYRMNDPSDIMVTYKEGFCVFNASDETGSMESQRPLIALLQLATLVPEAASSEWNDHLVILKSRYCDQLLLIIRKMFACRIPISLLIFGRKGLLFDEFNDLIASEPSYFPRFVVGSARSLCPLTANENDPRVFASIRIDSPSSRDYCPHVLGIKTKQTCGHLDNLNLYEDLPHMPHLESLHCAIEPIGVHNAEIAREHYAEFGRRWIKAAPNLKEILLSTNCDVYCASVEKALLALGRFAMALKSTVDGLTESVPNTKFRLKSLRIHLPETEMRAIIISARHYYAETEDCAEFIPFSSDQVLEYFVTSYEKSKISGSTSALDLRAINLRFLISDGDPEVENLHKDGIFFKF
ncbi:unnamed protein product [Bursaphelenchus xylophilus]|uniref:(pine wood nematode) hypothetical protein n=1 Tax=Bursaphelenchus xylophilus TaxID=6326 RepID=A0A1I7SB08_BURXY|nr:unnamed protein product [Bursaphelenchus xylophilus]CAG9105935.1 unnamed protein product [Bursaphelenchus xylophilus]